MTVDRRQPTRWRPGTRFYLRSGMRTVVRVVAIALAIAVVLAIIVVGIATNTDIDGLFQVVAYVVFGIAVVVTSIWALVKRFYIWLRRHNFVTLARQNGFAYLRNDERLRTISRHEPFEPQSASWAFDSLRGRLNDRPVTMFRYVYRLTESASPALISSRICLVELPAPYPDFQLRVDDYVVTSVTPGLLPTDGDIEDEEFNRRYRVPAKDVAARRLASDLLNPRVVEWLLSTEPFPWRIEGRLLIGWWSDAVSPAGCLDRMRALCGVAASLPAFRAQ